MREKKLLCISFWLAVLVVAIDFLTNDLFPFFVSSIFFLQMNQLCKVCGEPAAGFHFGAFTCEGCKVRTLKNYFTSFFDDNNHPKKIIPAAETCLAQLIEKMPFLSSLHQKKRRKKEKKPQTIILPAILASTFLLGSLCITLCLPLPCKSAYRRLHISYI